MLTNCASNCSLNKPEASRERKLGHPCQHKPGWRLTVREQNSTEVLSVGPQESAPSQVRSAFGCQNAEDAHESFRDCKQGEWGRGQDLIVQLSRKKYISIGYNSTRTSTAQHNDTDINNCTSKGRKLPVLQKYKHSGVIKGHEWVVSTHCCEKRKSLAGICKNKLTPSQHGK